MWAEGMPLLGRGGRPLGNGRKMAGLLGLSQRKSQSPRAAGAPGSLETEIY